MHPPLKRYCKKKQLRRIKKKMRLFRANIKEVGAYAPSEMQHNIQKLQINMPERACARLFPLIPDDVVEITLRQIIISRIGGNRLHKAVFHRENHTAFGYPVPPDWLGVLGRYGVNCTVPKPKIVWSIFVILVGVFGVLRSFQRYFLVTTTKKPKQIYDAHFVRLPANALPHDDPISSKTLVAWVWRHYFSSKERAFFSYDPPHNTELQQAKFSSNGQKTFLPYLSKLDALRVIFWTLRNFILSLKDTLKGNWFSLFLLHEAIDYKIFEIAKSENLARSYWFSHEHCQRRPFWTYSAEKGQA